MSPPEWIVTATGLALVFLVLRDVFHTLLHPAGTGQLSPLLFRAVWRICRRLRFPPMAIAGPLGFAAVAATWALLMAAGWALIYWPHLPDGFVVADGVPPERSEGPLDALYVSMVALTTLGFGDLAPASTPLRLAFGLEAGLGFVLLSAVISWILSVAGVLGRRRALAGRLSSLLEGDGEAARFEAGRSPQVLALTLESLADELSAAHVDLLQFPSTFFFVAPEPELSLSPKLAGLRAAVGRDDLPEQARASGRGVDEAIERLAHSLAGGPWGLDSDPAKALRQFADEHEAALR